MDCDHAYANQSPPAIVQQMPMVGGFKPVSLNTAEAQVAYSTAIKLAKSLGDLEQFEFAKPELLSVGTQVVAGRNYRVKFRAGAAGDRHVLDVLYYQPLKGAIKLQQVDFDGAGLM